MEPKSFCLNPKFRKAFYRVLVHFLISITDGEHGLLQHLKGQQPGHEHQLHAGESVEGGVPAWVKYT